MDEEGQLRISDDASPFIDQVIPTGEVIITRILSQFYDTYLSAMDADSGDGNCSAMAISRQFSKGIYALEERLKTDKNKLPFVKVQTTGPCSFTLSVVDESGELVFGYPIEEGLHD